MNNFVNNNENQIISNYILDKFKLWVWDFDDTLIDTATYYRKSMEPVDILKRTEIELNIEVPNWRYFKKIVTFLVSRGIRVGIASFGTQKIIRAYMDRIFGINQKLFTKVNLHALCRDMKGKPTEFYPNKNAFIERLMEHYRIYEPIKIVLFDDNMTNISDAMVSGLVGVKIVGKDNHMYERSSYTENPCQVYFGNFIINKLEKTLKRLEKRDKEKEGCSPNNLKNETFSSIGDRKVGIENEKYRNKRYKFLQNIKNKTLQKEESLKEEFISNNNNNNNQQWKTIHTIHNRKNNKNQITGNINNNNNQTNNISQQKQQQQGFKLPKLNLKINKKFSIVLILLCSLLLISLVSK